MFALPCPLLQITVRRIFLLLGKKRKYCNIQGKYSYLLSICSSQILLPAIIGPIWVFLKSLRRKKPAITNIFAKRLYGDSAAEIDAFVERTVFFTQFIEQIGQGRSEGNLIEEHQPLDMLISSRLSH